jgi:hypothetical protein
LFDGVRYSWRLHKLHRERNTLRAEYRAASEAAQAAQKSQLEIDRLFFEERMKLQVVDAKINELLSERLITAADRYLVPRPEFKSEGGAWIKTSVEGRWHLTIEAMAELRSAIRRERKERWENSRTWLAAWTGLIGTLIGLASILLRK